MTEASPKLSPFPRFVVIAAATIAVFLLLGYHPYAEDGGIYLTTLLQRLHPQLYPHSHAFAGERLPHSAYLWMMQVLAHGVPVMWLLPAVQAVGLFFTLDAILRITQCSFSSSGEQMMAFITAAIGLGLPVAGTALYIVDPYVTARSLSTPLLLYALYAILTRRSMRAAGLTMLALFLHPLMALWGALLLAACYISQRRQTVASLALFSGTAWLILGVLHFFSPHEDALSQTLAHSRSYWYLTQWEWYEWAGILAPPLLLALRYLLRHIEGVQAALTRSVVAIFMLAAAVSITWIHIGSSQLLLARIQPLRMLHLGYIIFLILFGGWAGGLLGRRRAYLYMGGTALLLAACALFSMERSLYASSQHIEWPFVMPRNAWEQAFLWIRDNTPEDALFAMDAHYISSAGEEAQSFRAIAQRSALPDYSKDGGVASVFTSLAPEWKAGEETQRGLNRLSDADRVAQLKPTGADWIVLPQSSETSFDCPYKNNAVKVCRLPHAR